MRLPLLLLFVCTISFAQQNRYSISFENALHHEAKIHIEFPEIKTDTFTVRMSRSSPGRYAIHEFAKNVYEFKATDSKGKQLEVFRPDPYSWAVTGHSGIVNIEYTLFANRGDGTYSQIDPTHAHLNMPATFMFAESLQDRAIEIDYNTESQPNWKVATQLKHIKRNTYTAPNLQYFMDSPTEISNFRIKKFELDGKTIRFVLHDPSSDELFEEYFQKVKKIVEQEMKVYGELPNFDYGEYTFLACYMPNVSGDGMEHRNSTILTDTETLANGGMKGNIGTVSHEFFHAWNVERIRPKSLEPFDFTKANMSGALWFAEGFTSYYTNLILCRAGIISAEDYINGLNGSFNYVWTSPALQYFNPIEMSYQAPFVDAATSLDPVNRENTFISYYSYGSVLGLALDLELRDQDLNLDDFMKLVWETYGKPEKPYVVKDIENLLKEYAGESFGKSFFNKYIYNSKMPEYKPLLDKMGINISRRAEEADLGISVENKDSMVVMTNNPKIGTSAYKGGLDKGAEIISVNNTVIKNKEEFNSITSTLKPGEKISIKFKNYDEEKTAEVTVGKNPSYEIKINADAKKKEVENREKWLTKK
ncbi:M61 family metallopeptidase [Zunongwangia sp. HGR-M22]|uniref:M61 family metallopeptidase n=1 Tax=Zunongwangia sp. HGR-M22 TaxID=3015168 RepID=UPI0022DD5A50|nr:PDZ domain-containing protein [Zunongwangia sp. HGR-M22]WBL25424.1 PDZ domain-containing protein [Zunongwangia sp. HGR-M22]